MNKIEMTFKQMRRKFGYESIFNGGGSTKYVTFPGGQHHVNLETGERLYELEEGKQILMITSLVRNGVFTARFSDGTSAHISIETGKPIYNRYFKAEVYPFLNGLAKVSAGEGMHFHIKEDGTKAYEKSFEYVSGFAGESKLAIASDDGDRQFYINTKGEQMFGRDFDSCTQFNDSDGKLTAIVWDNGESWEIDTDGKKVEPEVKKNKWDGIPYEYDQPEEDKSMGEEKSEPSDEELKKATPPLETDLKK